MLLKVAAALVLLGLVVWVIGELFDYIGVAALGATFLIIAGSAIALTRLEVQTGETQMFEYTTVNNSTVRDSATVAYDYQTTAIGTILNVGAVASLGLGGLLMLLGATLLGQTLAGQYE